MKSKFSEFMGKFSLRGTCRVLRAGLPGLCLCASVVTSMAKPDAKGRDTQLFFPAGIAADNAGTIFVADSGHDVILRITPAGTVTNLAGLTGIAGSADGKGSAARFDNPAGLALDSAGNVYVADSRNDTIRRVTPAGDVTTVAGLAGKQGKMDGIGSVARFHDPRSVSVDCSGNVYVADRGNHDIRRITPDGAVTTLAGRPGAAGCVDGIGNAARFCSPLGIVVDQAGNVYVADRGNCLLRKVTPSGAVTTIAGQAGQIGNEDGKRDAARFEFPAGVAMDNAGNFYVADPCNDEVRKVTTKGAVSTFAGSAGLYGLADGHGMEARFNFPTSIATDGKGNIYVADTLNNAVRRITPAGLVTTVAGRAPAGD
jgi:sugar lactone lactonase YvrE